MNISNERKQKKMQNNPFKTNPVWIAALDRARAELKAKRALQAALKSKK